MGMPCWCTPEHNRTHTSDCLPHRCCCCLLPPLCACSPLHPLPGPRLCQADAGLIIRNDGSGGSDTAGQCPSGHKCGAKLHHIVLHRTGCCIIECVVAYPSASQSAQRLLTQPQLVDCMPSLSVKLLALRTQVAPHSCQKRSLPLSPSSWPPPPSPSLPLPLPLLPPPRAMRLRRLGPDCRKLSTAAVSRCRHLPLTCCPSGSQASLLPRRTRLVRQGSRPAECRLAAAANCCR